MLRIKRREIEGCAPKSKDGERVEGQQPSGAHVVENPTPLRSREDREAGLSGISTSRGLVEIPDNGIAPGSAVGVAAVSGNAEPWDNRFELARMASSPSREATASVTLRFAGCATVWLMESVIMVDGHFQRLQ